MSMKINNTIYQQTYQPVTQKNNAEKCTFSLPSQSGEDVNSNEVQKSWLSNAMQLPEGIGMTGQRMIEFLESQAAPIIYNFEELYNQFGIEVHWEYENGHRVRGIVENSAENHRAFVQMKTYMDKIATQQIAAGNRFVTPPDSVLYEGLY